MSLMGAITGTVTQASGGSCSAGSSGNTDGTLPFSGAPGSYTLKFSLPSGMTTYPDDGGKTLVTLSNAGDSAKKWSVGHNDQAGRGIINFDGKKGTINVTLAYHGPSGSPELGPVIASGTFACP